MENKESPLKRIPALLNAEGADTALALIDEGLEKLPENPKLLLCRAIVFFIKEEFAQAEQMFSALIRRHPYWSATWSNRSLANYNLFDTINSLLDGLRAVELSPEIDQRHVHLGLAAYGNAYYQLAETAFRKSLSLNPNNHDSWFNLSLVLLGQGQFEEGVAAYEKRWHLTKFSKSPSGQALLQAKKAGVERLARETQPLNSLKGKTIFICSEQGAGDFIMFSRYIPQFVEAGAKVCLGFYSSPRELIPFFRRWPGVISAEYSPHIFDKDYLMIPVGSLPYYFDVKQKKDIAKSAILPPLPEEKKRWRERLDNAFPVKKPSSSRKKSFSGKRRPRIMVNASGNLENPVTRFRSPRLKAFLPLFEREADFILVKPDIPETDRAAAEGIKNLYMPGAFLSDYNETLALMTESDLMILSDSSVLNLGGTLASHRDIWPKGQVWGVLGYQSDWRWLFMGETSPWYPDVRLFRQSPAETDDWSGVVERVGLALDEWLEQWQGGGEGQTGEHRPYNRLEETKNSDHSLVERVNNLLNAEGADTALTLIDEGLEKSPEDPYLLLCKAIVFFIKEEFAQAEQMFGALIRRYPYWSAAWGNRSFANHKLYDVKNSLLDGLRAVELSTEFPLEMERNQVRVGLAAYHSAYYQLAETAFRKSLSLNPNNHESQLNLGVVLLGQGQFEEGFQGYEKRWHVLQFSETTSNQVMLQAEKAGVERFSREAHPLHSLKGKTIFMCSEQGAGDFILFSRYIPLLVKAGAKVYLGFYSGMRGLIPFFRRWPGVVGAEYSPDTFGKDWLITPIGSLPYYFDVKRKEDIPKPAIQPPVPEMRTRWQERLDATFPPKKPASGKKTASRKRRPRILVNASGNLENPGTRFRSPRLKAFLPLFEREADFILVKPDIPEDDRAAAEGVKNLYMPGELLGDYNETLALMTESDLMILSDSSVLNLGGTLSSHPDIWPDGQVWGVLGYQPDWRWLHKGDTSPWYPNVRLFRQSPAETDDWSGVVERVGQALDEWIGEWLGTF